MEVENIIIEDKSIMDKMLNWGFISDVRRFKYPVKDNKYLAIVQAIGKMVVPNFVIDESNQWAYTQLAKWLFGDNTMEAMDPRCNGKMVHGRLNAGIYLAGGTGTGKSVALKVLKILARYFDIKVGIGDSQRKIYWTEKYASEICMDYANSGDLNTYINDQITCIQDLGAEPMEVSHMGNKINTLRQIIEARADKGGNITLFSSNLPMRQDIISNLYGDRVYSRLVPMCNYIVMKGKDRRRIYG